MYIYIYIKIKDADVWKQIQRMLKLKRKRSDKSMSARPSRWKLLNASHIKVLQAQDDVANDMKDSLLQLKELSVLLRCHDMDVNLVNSVLEDAKCEYAKKAKVHAPKHYHYKVYLPPPPSVKHHWSLFNTMDAGLDVVFRQKLPEIRKRLCG
ncbi:hypothetical protein Pfo_004528 [Paulownia fortunei]|nr:hypothetical protein Pfo_004528 [Paulownia fortunei]